MPSAGSPAFGRGVAAATGCYVIWGLVPLYWRQLADIDALELIAHRHVWSLVFVSGLVAVQGGYRTIAATLSGWRGAGVNAASAVLLTGNWLIYVWGVNHGHVVEASLGYFLSPLVNVACGRLVLKEHLSRLQGLAIACASAGVGLFILQLGRAPWIALGLAATWGGYSLMRKQSPLGPLTGLATETLLLAPLAVAFLIWREQTGAGVFGHLAPGRTFLLAGAGVITAVPLLLFAYGARRIRLSTMGLLQYITPTTQFALALWVFDEPFPRERLVCFALIWTGLALYTADSVWRQRALNRKS